MVTPTFSVIAVAIAVVALLFVLRPMLRQRMLAAVLVFASLATSVLLYRQLGTPDAIDPAMRNAPKTLAEARSQLERQLRNQPDQPDGWRLLGRAYTAEGRTQDAAEAYARAAALDPNNPDALVEAAESRTMASAQHRFDAQAIAQLDQALKVNPQHERALWFRGIAERQANRPAEAAKRWETLLPLVAEATAAPLREQINEARAEAGLPPLPAAAAKPASPKIEVQIALSDAARALAASNPNARVFVIARQAGGPPMPVAVERHAPDALPTTVTLDDSDSLMPTRKLSDLQDVEVLARLSLTGNATPEPGDISSAPVTLRMPTKSPVRITLDTKASTP